LVERDQDLRVAADAVADALARRGEPAEDVPPEPPMDGRPEEERLGLGNARDGLRRLRRRHRVELLAAAGAPCQPVDGGLGHLLAAGEDLLLAVARRGGEVALKVEGAQQLPGAFQAFRLLLDRPPVGGDGLGDRPGKRTVALMSLRAPRIGGVAGGDGIALRGQERTRKRRDEEVENGTQERSAHGGSIVQGTAFWKRRARSGPLLPRPLEAMPRSSGAETLRQREA